jgi:hypothetical protein
LPLNIVGQILGLELPTLADEDIVQPAALDLFKQGRPADPETLTRLALADQQTLYHR